MGSVVMPQLAYRNVWVGAGYLFLVIILTIALIKVGPIGTIMMLEDKVLHALCFMFLMVWFCGLYARAQYLRIGILLFLYGALIEALQYLTGYRSMELADLVADVIGILAGAMLARMGLWRWCEVLEQRIMRLR